MPPRGRGRYEGAIYRLLYHQRRAGTEGRRVAVAEEKDDGCDPREVAGLCKAIPKRNLGELLHEQRGMVAEFADAMGVSRETVSRWVSGTRRMDDSQVAKASWLLGVHPLYLLDMRDEADPSISYIVYEDEGLFVPRKSMAKAVGLLSIPASGQYDEESHRWVTLCGFMGGRTYDEGMCVDPDLSFESESKYVPMSAEEADDLREEAIHSLVAIDGDYRNPSGIMFAMLGIILSTAGGSECVFAFDELAKMFGSLAYTNESNLILEDNARGFKSGYDNAMQNARARLVGNWKPTANGSRRFS